MLWDWRDTDVSVENIYIQGQSVIEAIKLQKQEAR
jgi:hypothetical protein